MNCVSIMKQISQISIGYKWGHMCYAKTGVQKCASKPSSFVELSTVWVSHVCLRQGDRMHDQRRSNLCVNYCISRDCSRRSIKPLPWVAACKYERSTTIVRQCPCKSQPKPTDMSTHTNTHEESPLPEDTTDDSVITLIGLQGDLQKNGFIRCLNRGRACGR